MNQDQPKAENHDDGAIYVLLVVPGREATAQRELLAAGVACYAPLSHRWRRLGHASRARHASAIFPGYLFVRSDAIDADLARTHGSRYVIGFLGMNDKPSPLPRGMAEWLGWFLVCQSFALFDRTLVPRSRTMTSARPKIKTGELIRILGGPFQGWLIEVKEMRRDGALIEVLGGKFIVPYADVEKAA